MDQSMRERAEYLYPGRGETVTRRLEAILEDFRGHDEHSNRAPRPYSESDVVLICYGDHVHQAGEKTLVALDEFIRRYAAPSIPCVHILPFFPYSSDDGFSVIDYYQVKQDLGDWSDIRRIGSTVELMFDLVINHVSAQSAWFQGFLSGESTHSDYFIAFEHPVDVSTVFRPRTHPLLTASETAQGRRYVWTTFSSDQIDVNFANPDVLLAYIRILLFYVHQGAGVIRLDAIAYLWKELGTSSLHLPQTHAVVKLLRQILDDVAPDVWIITETNVPHKDNVSYFGDGHDEAHLVYNFALPPLLLHTLLSGDASALSAWAKMLESPSEDTTFFNFTASHDGIGVTPLRGLVSEDQFQRVVDSVRERGGRVNFRTVPGQEPVPYELNIVYLDAVGGVEPFLASQAIALALRGVPAIYFNSLIGARNWTEGVERLGYNRAINREKFDLPALSAELDTAGTEKHRIHQALTHQIQVRRREPLFSPAAGQTVVNLDPRVFALLRTRGEDRLLAVTSVTAEIATVDGTRLATELGRKSARDVLTDHQVPLTKSVRLEPYQTLWLREA